MSVAQKLAAAGSLAAAFLYTQISANPITESVELLPIMLYNDDVEFDAKGTRLRC